jgi:hypothetical protein
MYLYTQSLPITNADTYGEITISLITLEGPAGKNGCGHTNWRVKIVLKNRAGITGNIVQSVRITARIFDCKTAEEKQPPDPAPYYESWSINKGASSPQEQDDTYKLNAQPCTVGWVEWEGFMKYMPGLTSPDRWPKDPNSPAGTLPSIPIDQARRYNFRWYGYQGIRHILRISWNCCNENPSPTIIEYLEPKT